MTGWIRRLLDDHYTSKGIAEKHKDNPKIMDEGMRIIIRGQIEQYKHLLEILPGWIEDLEDFVE